MEHQDVVVGQTVKIETRICQSLFYGMIGRVVKINRSDIGVHLPDLKGVPQTRYFTADELSLQTEDQGE